MASNTDDAGMEVYFSGKTLCGSGRPVERVADLAQGVSRPQCPAKTAPDGGLLRAAKTVARKA